jgi:sec-independent protein translocase protein TatC
MSVLDHLRELRTRILIMMVALFVAFFVASFVPIPAGSTPPGDILVRPLEGTTTITSEVVRLLLAPISGHVQAIRPGEVLFTYFKIALFTGIGLAMPILVYQIMLFVLPALLPHEKRYLYLALPGVFVSFLIGGAFGYLVIVPFALKFLLSFGGDLIEQKWALEEYLDTIATLLFWMGVAFEMPLIMFFLSKVGVVNVKRLASFRRYMIVLAFVVGAFITPTPDPFNQALVSIPLYLLYELGLLLARLA